MNKVFSSWATHLPKHASRITLITGLLAVALVFSAFSFASAASAVPVHFEGQAAMSPSSHGLQAASLHMLLQKGQGETPDIKCTVVASGNGNWSGYTFTVQVWECSDGNTYGILLNTGTGNYFFVQLQKCYDSHGCSHDHLACKNIGQFNEGYVPSGYGIGTSGYRGGGWTKWCARGGVQGTNGIQIYS